MVSRLGVAALALMIVTAACSDGRAEPSATTPITVEFEDQGPFTVTRPVGCEAAPESATDLDAEPEPWLAFGQYMRWFDSEDCPVRVDVIAHTHGAEHCGWEAAEFITLGATLGESFSSSLDSRRFVWNGEAVIPGLEESEVLPRSWLPASALDTGYRQGDNELWLDDADPSVVLVIEGGTVRVFDLEPTTGLCA